MYTIGRLARRARVNVDSVRFYERQGLLAPESKTASGYRLYGDEALRRIVFIKHAQRCGFSLTEIGDLLRMHNGTVAERRHANDLLVEKRMQIEQTIESLRTMCAALDSVLPSSTDEDAPITTVESPLVVALAARLAQRVAA
ncbi:MAG TPA: MerR family transcriptional regulator [Burkholderiales bacterium]|nr:MerR family transcriptional regulator [Burkholderiales bacterium]